MLISILIFFLNFPIPHKYYMYVKHNNVFCFTEIKRIKNFSIETSYII